MMDLTFILQLILSGITEGSIYVMIALGVIIVYKCTNVVNFAQGEFVVLGGLIYATLTQLGVSIILSFLITALSIGIVGGALVGFFGFRPFIKRNVSPGTIIIATIGILNIIKMIMVLIWGRLPVRVPSFSGEEPIRFLGLFILPQALWVIGITAVTFVGVLIFLDKTLIGKSFRACSENRFFARLLGINDTSMLIVAVIISALLGAIGGVAITPISYAKYDMGIHYTVNGFIAAVLGGLDKPVGALYGGMLIGILYSLSAGMLGSGFASIIIVLTLLAVLVFKPTGIVAGISGGRK